MNFIARLPAVASCLPLLLLMAYAHAQTSDLTEISFEDLASIQVSSASKFSQSTREAPSSVELITREDIRRHGWRKLSEALSSLTGIYGASDQVYDYLGTRGFLVPGDYNTRFLVLIDGQRSNDNIYEQGSFSEEFPLDLGLVERIEYVPGPGSSIYGSNAIFGVINVITRRADEMPPLQLAARLSQDGWREVRTSGAVRLDSGASVLLSVTAGDKDGNERTYADPTGGLLTLGGATSPDGVAPDLDRQRKRQFFGRYEDGNFSLAARHAERRVQPSSAPYGTLFNDPGLVIEDVSTALLGRFQKQLTDTLGIDARLEFGEMTYQADYPYDDGIGNRFINRDDTLGRWWAGEVRTFFTGLAGHKIVAGVDAQRDTVARQRNFDIGGATVNPPIDVDSRRHRTGIYGQDEWAFADRWRINAGFRQDNLSDGASSTSPRLGLIWLNSELTTFKLLAGRAYRVPNAYERDYANGLSYLANSTLKPETIRTIEGVWEQQLGRQQDLRVAVFDYSIANLIAQIDTGGGLLQYQNQAKIKAHGLEAGWRVNWDSGAQFAASWSLNHTEDANGRRPGFSPKWIFKVRASLPLAGDRWLLSTEARAIGATEYLWNGTPQRLATQVTVDANLTTARLAPGLDGHLRVRNLFDRRHRHPSSDELPVPAIPDDRRTWEIGLRYIF